MSKRSQVHPSAGDSQSLSGELSWDYCLVYKPEGNDSAEVVKNRRVTIKKLKVAGLMVEEMRRHHEIYVLVTATIERFEEEADRQSIEMRLLPENKNAETGSAGYEEFSIKNKHRFEGVNKPRFFSSLERQRLLQTIFEAPKSEHGCGLNIEKLKAPLFTAVFPLTHEEAIDELNKEWVWSLKPQPLDKVRDYLGEKVAMYFAFLGHYTTWLVYLSVFGLITQGVQWYNDDADHPIVPVYCVFLCVWTTLFLESWKREQATQAFKWDVQDFEEEERIRPEYAGMEQKGIWVGPLFIPAEELKGNAGAYELETTKYFPTWRRVLRYLVSGPVIGSFVIGTIAGTVAILVGRGVWALPDPIGWGRLGQVGGGMLNAGFITFMNLVYKQVAKWLNDFENYRTDTEYEDQLIGKVFLFQFINSYSSLFYIAFFKGKDIEVLGMKSLPCRTSCLDEMSTQLLSLVVLMQIIGNMKEIAIPYMMGKVQMLLSQRSKFAKKGDQPPVKKLTKYEFQRTLAKYPSTFDDYNEMAIQFGFVTLFAAAFPFASFASLLNNLVEIRSDAYKLLNHTQRPVYMGCEDIGSWQKVFTTVATLAVVTNVCIVGFTSMVLSGKCEFRADIGDYFKGDAFRALHHGYSQRINGTDYMADCSDSKKNVCCPKVYLPGSTTNIIEPVKSTHFLTDYEVLLAVVICEHAILLFRWVLSEMIPDRPTWVVKAQARIDLKRTQRQREDHAIESGTVESDEWSDTPDPEPTKYLEPQAFEFMPSKDD